MAAKKANRSPGGEAREAARHTLPGECGVNGSAFSKKRLRTLASTSRRLDPTKRMHWKAADADTAIASAMLRALAKQRSRP